MLPRRVKAQRTGVRRGGTMTMAEQAAGATPRITLSTLPLARQSLRDRVYEIVLQAIVNGDFPPGHQIRDLDIAESLGVSRTPVREALQRLVNEGLVETTPAATRVTPIDTRAVRSIYPIVGALHALAVRLGADRIGRAEIDALADANELFARAVGERHIAGALAADDAFHGVVIDTAENPALRRTLDMLMPHIRRLQLTQFSSKAARLSIRQHRDIIASCRRGRFEDAARTMEQNWANIESLLR
jgi:DNA-binding GntR family transcriptional regulator